MPLTLPLDPDTPRRPRFRQLILSAQDLAAQGQNAAALIAAFIASEVITENSLYAMFCARDLAALANAVFELIPSFNSTSARVRPIYVALSGRDPAEASFWSALKTASKLRNELVHGSRRTVTKAQVHSALQAVKDYAEWITQTS